MRSATWRSSVATPASVSFYPVRRPSEDVRDLVDRWLAHALKPEHRFIVEKAPAGAAAVANAAKLYPDALIVHVARDGRDVAVSTAAANASWARGDYKAEPKPLPRRALWGIGLGWAGQVSQLRHQAMHHLDLPFHEVRYEDMHAKPRETARQLFDFCGIPTDDALLDEILEQTHFSKLPKTGEHSFRRKGQAGGWREEWGRWEKLLFSAAAGELLEQMGYAPPMPKRAQQLRSSADEVGEAQGLHVTAASSRSRAERREANRAACAPPLGRLNCRKLGRGVGCFLLIFDWQRTYAQSTAGQNRRHRRRMGR